MKKVLSLTTITLITAAFVFGCGSYQVQGKYSVGPPLDQQEPAQVVDANGNVRVKPAQNATADLIGLGDVRFGQRSYQGAGTLTTPAKQIQIRETRTVREETYQDRRKCPDKSQVKEVKTGDVKHTETYARTVDIPAQTVPLDTTLNAGDGPGTVLLGKALEAAGFAGGMIGGAAVLRPDRTNVNQTGASMAGAGAEAGAGAQSWSNSCSTSNAWTGGNYHCK